MIKYIKKTFYNYDINSYILYDDESKKCLIIDLGGDFSEISALTDRYGLTVEGVILTHGHYDHIAGARDALDKGVKIFAGEEEYELLKDPIKNVSRLFGKANYGVEITGLLREGRYGICGIDFEVIKTPGHTQGSICILVGDLLFSGDTLFCGSFGRCDLPTGDIAKLKNSITNKLFTLCDGVTVLPGHGDATTIEKERKSNPINGINN